jgi:hypothetical protein
VRVGGVAVHRDHRRVVGVEAGVPELLQEERLDLQLAGLVPLPLRLGHVGEGRVLGVVERPQRAHVARQLVRAPPRQEALDQRRRGADLDAQ